AQRGAPFPDWPTRAARLRALETLIRQHRREIVEAIDADFGGRPSEETDLLEIFPSLGGIAHALRHGRRWMRPRRRFATLWFLPARTHLLPQPLGLIGVIVPWNYPLYLAVGPITDALAAGNHVLVKMSEFTPRFSALFAALIARHFPAGEVRIINGDADVAQTFSSLPFDHLLFTGSTAVGHQVMRAAAENLTPVTLELGGKSPALIGPGARFEHAVERIVLGKCVNAGQTCIAPDYVLIERERQAAFVDIARSVVARFYPEFASNRQYASIISERHFQRLVSLRDGAVADGAKVYPLADDPGPGRRMAPTVLTDVDPATSLMREEIFGPLLPLVPYDSLDEALNFIAVRPRPLALYLFDDDATTIERMLERTIAGGVTVNDTLYHIAQHYLPFGGVGASGMGAYHGEDGFRTFSKMKPIFRQARVNFVGLLDPPYGVRFQRLLRFLVGR
ncbi:MAG: coniferyl aldehyde dehydrogenase, partial [Rhodanobacteraceae bacterium]